MEGKENAEIASFSQSETYTGPNLEFGWIRVNHVDSNGGIFWLTSELLSFPCTTVYILYTKSIGCIIFFFFQGQT